MIPVLFFSLTAGSYVAKLQTAQMLGFQICAAYSLRSQEKTIQTLNRLKKLNPKAKSIRAKIQKLEKKIALAVETNPPLVAALAAQLAIAKARQFALDLKQKAIIWSAKEYNQYQLHSMQQHLNKQFNNNNFSYSTPIAVHFSASPPLEMAPEYRAPLDWSKQQYKKFIWKTEVQPKIFKFTKTNVNGQCATTITKRRGKWVAQIAPDK